jgi:predicted nucleotidyltransferase
MIYKFALDDILGNKLKLRILRLFCMAIGEYTGREIAKLTGYSQTYTMRALSDLEANGLLFRRDVGRSHLYSLNQKHMMVRELTKLFNLERNALEKVAQYIKDGLGESLRSIVVFGSVARGEERPGSDIDMILTLNDGAKAVTESEISSVSIAASAASGNPISPILVTVSELEKIRAKKDKKGMWREVFGEEPVVLIDFDRDTPRLRHIESGKYLPSIKKESYSGARRKA